MSVMTRSMSSIEVSLPTLSLTACAATSGSTPLARRMGETLKVDENGLLSSWGAVINYGEWGRVVKIERGRGGGVQEKFYSYKNGGQEKF